MTMTCPTCQKEFALPSPIVNPPSGAENMTGPHPSPAELKDTPQKRSRAFNIRCPLLPIGLWLCLLSGWSAVTNTHAPLNGQNTLTLPVSGLASYCRLHSQ